MPAHDSAIQRIHARGNHCCYGMGLGIIILDDIYPGFPGDVRNASAYPFPIQYEIAEGVDIKSTLRSWSGGMTRKRYSNQCSLRRENLRVWVAAQLLRNVVILHGSRRKSLRL